MTDNMFDQTISGLMNSDLIGREDIIFACTDYVEGVSVPFFRSSLFVIAANNDGLSIFKVDKKTGSYSEDRSVIKINEIIKATVQEPLFGKKHAGIFTVVINTTSGNRIYSMRNKFKGHVQNEQIVKLKELFESAAYKAQYQKNMYEPIIGPVDRHGNERPRESYGLMSLLGAIFLITYALVSYFLFPNIYSDDNSKNIYTAMLLVLAALSMLISFLIIKGVLLKGIRSRSEIASRPGRRN